MNSFLGKLGPNPSSSREFWNLINRTRAGKCSRYIPHLVYNGRTYSSDEEKAELFGLLLSETFSENRQSSDFDSEFCGFVERFVAGYNLDRSEFDPVS